LNNSPLMALALTGGGWVIWALVLSSIGGVAVAYDRWNLLREESKALASLRPLFLAALAAEDQEAAEKALKTNPGAAARVLSEPNSLDAALSDEKRHLEGRLLWLGTLGNNAPFVGLFGTVLGVIKAFHDLAESGAGPEVVMSGLSEALIATAIGLLVAIPAVLAYNFLQKKLRDLLSETESLGRRYASVRTAHARRG
jgi:biopolymer transport protein ExbB/TolQ